MMNNYWVYTEDCEGNNVNFDAGNVSNIKPYGKNVYVNFYHGSPAAMAHGEEIAIPYSNSETAFRVAKAIGIEVASKKDQMAYEASKSKLTKTFDRVKVGASGFKLPSFLKRNP